MQSLLVEEINMNIERGASSNTLSLADGMVCICAAGSWVARAPHAKGRCDQRLARGCQAHG